MMVMCLCCGSSYNEDYDCPNLDRRPHSVELALRVAELLQERGMPPTGNNVRAALAEIQKRARA